VLHRWIGATRRGRTRFRFPAPQKCHNRGGRRWPRVIRTCARANDQQLAPPERASGRSVLVWRPAERVPPSRREPSLSRRTLRGGRRSDRLLSANSSTAPTTPTRTPYKGAGRGRGRQTRRRHRVRRKRWILASPRGGCSHYLSGVVEPRRPCFPRRWWGQE
jgi:hypothetical protein